jgi:hypothetical protein
VTPFRVDMHTIINAWCFGDGEALIVCTTRRTAERLADLIARHGLDDGPLELPPMVTTEEVDP